MLDHSSLLCCPGCGGDLAAAATFSCLRCGDVGRSHGGSYLDFNKAPGDIAAKILAWPDDFLRRLPIWAEANDGTISSDELQHHGLATGDGELTLLGRNVHYHLDEFRWQAGRKGLDGVLDLDQIGANPRVLDVGCGAGQTLRRLEPGRPLDLFGVDCDPMALRRARLARIEGIPLTMVSASGVSLPFREAAFDLVITRVALNYMRQPGALREMTRVLRPGGFFFCRVENIWHDVGLIWRSPNVKSLVCRLRDFTWGSLHAITGWQMTPGSLLRGGRAFASRRRLCKTLGKNECEIVHAAPSPNGPTILGNRSQLIIVARKKTRQPRSPERHVNVPAAMSQAS